MKLGNKLGKWLRVQHGRSRSQDASRWSQISGELFGTAERLRVVPTGRLHQFDAFLFELVFSCVWMHFNRVLASSHLEVIAEVRVLHNGHVVETSSDNSAKNDVADKLAEEGRLLFSNLLTLLLVLLFLSHAFHLARVFASLKK